jgi:hypothetical protein
MVDTVFHSDSIPKSSAQSIVASNIVFATMVQLVQDSKDQGRGIVFYEKGDDVLYYYSLLDLQQSGAELVGATPELFQDLLKTVGGGYNFATEFVLVSPQRGDLTKFVAQVCPLQKNGRKLIRTDEQIKNEIAAEQKIAAKLMRQKMKMQRQGKRK